MPNPLIESSLKPSPSFPNLQSRPTTSLVLDGYLRREELAQQLGLSARTIDRWDALRIGPPRVTVGRTVLYSVQSVREWLISREQPTVNSTRRVRRSG